ncbi:replicative DNA helicase [Kibdelosporangium banguiense]|uniref:Replicative DNA helicase n=1 Tax=Kibdelosporangium banguiense TaxID=1365924 RepID=A0ABS4TXL7_9PSEU|nr:DnaB-like helicase C-terminal domain-containing protein [Kibdelosporangium banguiense]MBP2328715.1 replicative DNA helicase [Kibdelosporangium banguiense]
MATKRQRGSVDALAGEIAKVATTGPLELVAIDPLASMTATAEPNASREREVSIIVRRLKELALRLELPVVVTAELRRFVAPGVKARSGTSEA